jgi:hypothetical protein
MLLSICSPVLRALAKHAISTVRISAMRKGMGGVEEA